MSLLPHLKIRLQKLEARLQDHATVQAGIHRFWMNLRHVINQRNDGVVLSECIRGEEIRL